VRLLTGHDRAVADFLAGLSPIEQPRFRDGEFTGFGVINDAGALVAGIVFSDWRPAFRTVELSGAALDPRAFSIPIVAALGAYAFGQLNSFRVWARTSTDNRLARNRLRKFGFKEESVSAHHYGQGKHAVTLRLIRPVWERQAWAQTHDRKAA